MPTKLGNMLKAEMKASDVFYEQNKGHIVGHDFAQMCAEILYSDTIASMLINQASATALHFDEIGASLAAIAQTGDLKGKIGSVVQENHVLFDASLAMFYWGMRIGRQLERELLEKMQEVEQSYNAATKSTTGQKEGSAH